MEKGDEIRVLLIEDDPGEAGLIKEMLSKGGRASFVLDEADRLSAGFLLLSAAHFDAVLLDLGLPDSRGGLETLHALRESAPEVAVIVLTGLDDEEIAVGALQAGAQDYLTKGQSLLAYSRVGRSLAPFENTDFEQALDLSLHSLKSAIEESGATITHDLLPRISADPVMISQVFQDLIQNAIKYRSEKPPKIHITTEKRKAEYAFCVADNGIGIPEESAKAVFEIFRRIPGKKRQPGSGIGLAICKKIVELHGGRIWVESQERKGARFYFSIPVISK